MESNIEQITSLPKFWYIRCDIDNVKVLNKYFHSIGKKYYGYSDCWIIKTDCMYFYPQAKHLKWQWGTHDLNDLKKYTEITFKQFEIWVLNKNKIYELW
jgi:hypothetical protein